MARRGGRRGSRGRSSSRRSRGRTGGVGSSRSKSKSNKSKSKSTGGSRGRSSNTRGGQSKANRNQNKKARRTVKSIANSRVGKAVGKGLSTAGKVTRQLRQPMSGLASLGIRSVLNNPAIARSIAQYGVNTFGKQNQRTRDMSKLSPQQQRKYQRLSEKTGRDYSVRNPTFRLNMNMKDIARFAGLDQNRFYNKLPRSIREAQVNKQFYSNPMKKGWHSSQRTGRGQGITGRETRGVPDGMIRDMIGGRAEQDAARAQAQQQEQAVRRQYEYDNREYEMSKSQMGPQQDWLSQLYSSHNISGGKLDRGARDYWTNEAKTKGRDAVMQSIIGTSKVQGTYGGRKKPRSLNLQAKGTKRRQGMLAKTLAATMAARGM